jgi:pyrroline-5-carboxylate reductase
VKTTVFLGGGRITAALLAGLRLAKHRAPVIVHDRNPHKLHALKEEFGVAVEPDLRRAVRQARLLIVAVRPGDVEIVLSRLQELGGNSSLVACSLAAGIPLANLQQMLGPPVRWARAMPSPVARFGRGLTGLTFPGAFPRVDRALVRNFFLQVGEVVEIPESQFNVFTVTYSASHGYHALATLARAAHKLGLDGKMARVAAAHALGDAIVAWRAGKEPLDALLGEAATPAGIAATVMDSMDGDGYQEIIRRALAAGVVRARQNAKTTRGRRRAG